MKLHKNNLLKNIIIVLLIAAVLLVVVTPTVNAIYNSFHNNNVAQAQDDPPSVLKQAVNDADKFYSFEVYSEKTLNSKNFKEYVRVSDFNDNSPNYRLSKKQKNYYEILAPEDGYIGGTTYKIELKGVRFADEEMDSSSPFYFTVKRKEVVDVELVDTVKFLDYNSVKTEFMDDDIVLITGINGYEYAIEDVLIVPIYENDTTEVSLKVAEIISQTSNEFMFTYELPDESEVVEYAEIYKNQEIKFDESLFYSEWEEEVKDNVRKMSYVQEVHEAVNKAYTTKNKLPAWVTVIPTIKLKIEQYSPLQMKIEITWSSENIKARSNLTKDVITGKWVVLHPDKYNTPNLEAKIELSIKYDSEAFVSEKDGVKNTSTVDTSTISVKFTVGAAYKLEVIGELSKTYSNIKYNNASKKHYDLMAPYLKEANDIPLDHLKPGDLTGFGYSGRGRPTNEFREFLAEINLSVDEHNAKIESAKEFINNNGLGPDKVDTELFTFKTPPIAIGTPAVTLRFEVGFFLDISLNAEVGVEQIWKTTVESGTIEHNGKSENYHNEIKETTGNVAISGSVGIEVGIHGKAYFTFAGLVQLGVKAKIGIYFEASGMYSKAWGDGYINGVYNPQLGINNPEYDAKPWAANYDVGFRIELSGYVKFLIFDPYENTFYKYDKSFLGEDVGQKPMFDLISEPKQIEGFSLEDYKSGDIKTITIDENGYAKVPDIYKLEYDIKDNDIKVNKTPLSGEEYVISTSDYVYYDNGYVYLKDSSIKEFYDVIYAYLVVDGEVDENTFFPLIVTKEPIEVDNVECYTDVDGIQLGGHININSKCEPSNASYQQCEYALDYIIKNGVKITENLNDFAEISKYGLLTVTDRLSLGDKIAVKAHAIKDDVWSEPIEIEVVKTPVSEIFIRAEDYARSIGAGERVQIYPKAYPLNASFPDCQLYISSGSEYGKLVIENGNYFVECNQGVELGKMIGITASAENGSIISEEYLFTVGVVAVEKIEVEDEFGNKLLQRKTASNQIQQGNSLKLKTVYSPYNATVINSEYYLTDGSMYADIDSAGNFTVKTYAPVGAKITVIATADGVNSSEYTFEVVKVPVENIELNNYQCTETVKPGETVQFYPIITPDNATYISPVYTITEGDDYATVSAYGTLQVLRDAPVGAAIKLTAETDGVVSEEYELTIIPILAENLKLSAVNDTLKPGEGMQLNCVISPSTATYAEDVKYYVIEGDNYATVNENGYLQINEEVDKGDAVVKVQATLDDVVSNVLEVKIYVPVQSVEILFNSGNVTQMQVYMSEKFTVQVNPSYATNANEIEYLATNNAQFISLSDTICGCYVTVKENAVIGDMFSIAVNVDGVQSEDYFIEISKTPVTRIENNCDSNLDIGEGKAYTLNASAYPLNATYRSVSYRIKDGFDIADIVKLDKDKYVLQVQSGADKIGRTIKVIASADGIDGEPVVYTVVKNSVQYVNISDKNGKSQLLPDEATNIVFEVNEDATFVNAKYKISSGNEYAAITADGELKINSFVGVPDAKVGVTVTVDGTESAELIYDIFVPVSSILINSDNSYPRTGSKFKINTTVNSNATDKKMKLEITSGAEYIEEISLDDYGNGTFMVRDDIQISDAEVRFKATAQGVESLELTVNLVVPVTNVEVTATNYKPMQGETICVDALVYPEYATLNSVVYRLLNNVNGIVVNSVTGEVEVRDYVEVGTEFAVVAVSDGVESNPIYFTVQKVPVNEVIISERNNATEVRVGESINLSAQVLPVNATYKAVFWTILENGTGIVVNDNGRIDVSYSAPVGAVVKIKGTADGVDSNIFEFTLLKQPVSEVSLDYDAENAYGENQFIAGSTIKLFASVNENATYPDISFEFLDYQYLEFYTKGAKIGNVQEFVFKIKDDIDIPNANITFYAVADGVRSRQITIDVYNPVKELDISLSETGRIMADSNFAIDVVVNNGKNNSTVQPVLAVIQGAEYLNETAYGQYTVKSSEELAAILISEKTRSKKVVIKASGDGVDSNIIEFEIYVPVTSIEITEIPESITISSCDNYIKTKIFPEYATNLNVKYSIVNQAELPFVTINSLTGQITITNNKSYIGKNVIVRVDAADGVYTEREISITKIALEEIAVSPDTVKEILPGAQIELFSIPTPSNATFADNLNDVKYYLKSGSAYINGNILTVRSTAAINSDIVIYAIADGVQSEDYNIRVVSAPETSVRLYADSNIDFDNVKGGQNIQFYVDIRLPRPDTEADFPVAYRVEGPATISVDGLLTVKNRPLNNSKIKVYAEAVGVTKLITMTVKTPINLSSNLSVISEGSSAILTVSDADLFGSVSYYLDNDSISLGSLNYQTGVLTIKSGVKGNSVVKAYAIADGIRSNIIEMTIFVPVKNLTVSTSNSNIYSYTTQALMDKTTNDRISLQAAFNKGFSSNTNVRYIIESGVNYVQNVNIENGVAYIYDNFLQVKTNVGSNGNTIKLRAEVYGEYGQSVFSSNTQTVKILIPVENINLTRDSLGAASGMNYVQQQKSYTFSASVYPVYADDSAITFTADANYCSITRRDNKVTLAIKENAKLNGDFTLKASVANGVEKSYGLRVEEVWANSVSCSFKSLKNNSVAVLSKVYAGDILTANIDYAPINVSDKNKNAVLSFDSNSIITSNNYAYISGNQVHIKDVKDLREDEPQFNVYIWATNKDGKTEFLSDAIVVYIPVVDVKVGLKEVDRGSTADMQISYNSINGGYANPDAKSNRKTDITVSNNSAYAGKVIFNGDIITVPKDFNASNTITGKIITPDEASCEFSISIKALNLSSENVFYNNKKEFSTVSYDSEGRTMYSDDNAQLEENCFTYVCGKYNGLLISAYGVSYSVSTNSNYVQLAGTQIRIVQGAPGTHIATLTVTFDDGGKITTVTKKINVFNRVNNFDLVEKSVTKLNTWLYVTNTDSLASQSSNSYDFVAENTDNYSLTADGYFTVKNKAANKNYIWFNVNFRQKYNGTTILSCKYQKNVFVNILDKQTVTFHKSGDTSIVIDDKIYYDSFKYSSIDLSMLKSLGYSTITFTISVEMYEIDHGYQEVYLDVSRSGGCDTIWENRNIEHGGHNKKGNYWGTHEYSCVMNINDLYNKYGSQICIRLGYSAHGSYGDDWNRGLAQVKISAE